MLQHMSFVAFGEIRWPAIQANKVTMSFVQSLFVQPSVSQTRRYPNQSIDFYTFLNEFREMLGSPTNSQQYNMVCISVFYTSPVSSQTHTMMIFKLKLINFLYSQKLIKLSPLLGFEPRPVQQPAAMLTIELLQLEAS